MPGFKTSFDKEHYTVGSCVKITNNGEETYFYGHIIECTETTIRVATFMPTGFKVICNVELEEVLDEYISVEVMG